MRIGLDALGTEVDLAPEKFATAGTAILAMRGAGKSWLAAVLTEGLARERIPFALLDPEGEYWTLRVVFPTAVVAGGEHSDIPLEPELAEPLARECIAERLEMILDLSDLRRDKQIEFVSSFLSEIFLRETEARIPFWVCLEEADIWIPQSGNPLSKTPVLDICQRGRKRGMGFALVSQRPAIIDKTALSQAEYRFFKRFQQPHDLKAVAEYLEPHVEDARMLPSLAVSEALLYAPTMSSSPIKIQVAGRLSPHGGATPEQISRMKSSTTAVALRKKLEVLLQQRKQEESAFEKLQARIKELEAELSRKEDELALGRIAADVAGILSESAAKSWSGSEAAQAQEVGLATPQPAGSPVSEKESAVFKSAAEIDSDSFISLGMVGIDTHSGLVLGSKTASLLLNRLPPEERVVFLTMRAAGRPVSAIEVSRHSGLSTVKARNVIMRLARKGIVKPTGRDKQGRLFRLI